MGRADRDAGKKWVRKKRKREVKGWKPLNLISFFVFYSEEEHLSSCPILSQLLVSSLKWCDVTYTHFHHSFHFFCLLTSSVLTLLLVSQPCYTSTHLKLGWWNFWCETEQSSEKKASSWLIQEDVQKHQCWSNNWGGNEERWWQRTSGWWDGAELYRKKRPNIVDNVMAII